MRQLMGFFFSMLLVSCAPNADPWVQTNERFPSAPSTGPITVKTNHRGLTESATAAVDGRSIDVALTWRDYRSPSDDFQKTWYGDMGAGRPTFVAESLKLTVNGEVVSIPRSKYERLASQWPPNDARVFEISRKGSNLRLEINLGDGEHAWIVIYDFDPASRTLISSTVTNR